MRTQFQVVVMQNKVYFDKVKIFIDEVNKGLRSNQTAVSASEAKLKRGLFQ